MNKRSFLTALLTLAGLIASAGAFAHGGADDGHSEPCLAPFGPFTIYLKAYQPKSSPKQSFCGDLPDVGRSLFVMDFIDPNFRRSPIEVRVVENRGWFGRDEAADQETARTLQHLPPATYPQGSLMFRHSFQTPGTYAILLTVFGADGNTVSGKYAFSVGVTPEKIAFYVFACLLAVYGLEYYFGRVRPKRRRAKLSAGTTTKPRESGARA